MYIQIGTVMTKKAYRGQGLMRQLMNEIERDYAEAADGFFLFVNDKVLEYYPKIGFREAKEYEYWKEVTITGPKTAKRLWMEKPSECRKLEQTIEESVSNGAFEMK